MTQNAAHTKLTKSCSLFSQLSDLEIENILLHSTIKSFDRNASLYKAGSPATHVYILLMGSAKLVRHHPDGKERIVHILLPGEMFGAAVAIQGGAYPISAGALELSTAMEITRENFEQHFMSQRTIRQILMTQMGERLQQAHVDRIATFDSVEKRIAFFLIELLNRIQTNFPGTTRITVPLTRQDIADRVGSTVETVIRILTNLEKQNLLVTENRCIEIPNLKNLANSTGIDMVKD